MGNIKYLKNDEALKEFAEINSKNKQITFVAISTKPEASALLHNVAYTLSGIKSKFNDSMTFGRFGFMSNASKKLKKSFGIQTLPAFVAMAYHGEDKNRGEARVCHAN